MAPVGKTLTGEQKNVVVRLYKENMKQTEIARLFDVNHSTICGIIRRYEIGGDVENRPRSGRPKLLTPRDQRTLLRVVKASRSTPLSHLTNTFNQSRNRSVSRRTVQRILFQSGYHRRVIRKVVRIRHQNKRNRVAWGPIYKISYDKLRNNLG